MDPTPSDLKVKAQWDDFVAALPGLLPEHGGKWAVWFDGLQSLHDDEDSAERWALAHYDDDAGFVVAPVETSRPVSLSGMAEFRFRS